LLGINARLQIMSNRFDERMYRRAVLRQRWNLRAAYGSAEYPQIKGLWPQGIQLLFEDYPAASCRESYP